MIPPPPLGQTLQNLAMGTDANATSTMLHGMPPMQVPSLCTAPPNLDGNRSTTGPTTSVPTSTPGMYTYAFNTGTDIPAEAQSTTSNA